MNLNLNPRLECTIAFMYGPGDITASQQQTEKFNNSNAATYLHYVNVYKASKENQCFVFVRKLTRRV